jgi:hypothetical protein
MNNDKISLTDSDTNLAVARLLDWMAHSPSYRNDGTVAGFAEDVLKGIALLNPHYLQDSQK